MSHKNYPYTNTGSEFLSYQDLYPDSSHTQDIPYQPLARFPSQEKNRFTSYSNRTEDSSFHVPGMALSFLHSCGLDSSDIAHLAEIPAHQFTGDMFSQLLSQIKERKLSSSSSSRPSTSQPLVNTLTPAWEESSYSKPVEYPINLPVQPLFPLPPEQVQTWQDRWGNTRQMNYLPMSTRSSRSKSSSVSDYIVSKVYTGPYCDIKSLITSTRPSVDSRPKPLLSLKLKPPFPVPPRRETSDFNCKIPPDFPHMCSLCDTSVHSRKDWILHVQESEHAKSQLNLMKRFPKWAETVESTVRTEITEDYKVPTRREASDFNGIVPQVFPNLCSLCKITVFSEKNWSAHIISGQHAKSQLDLMGKYPEWDGTVNSSRRNNGYSSTDTRDGAAKERTSDMMSDKKHLCSRVVCFTPFPVGDGVTAELTAIAKRFGSIRKTMFLPNQGYVEMTCLADAKKLVEHYSNQRLKLKGKLIQVTFSCDYNSIRDAEVTIKTQSQKSHTHTICSLEKKRDSPSPRRCFSERTHSTLKRQLSSERTRSSPKRQCLRENTHSSLERRLSSDSVKSQHINEQEGSQKSKASSRPSSHSCCSSSSPAYHESEGLDAIADTDEEPIRREKLPSGLTDAHIEKQIKTAEDSPNAVRSQPSKSLQKGQMSEEHDKGIQEDHNLPKILGNFVTINEFMDENSSYCQETHKPNTSIPKTEKGENDIAVPPAEPSSVASSAAASEKSQDQTVAPTPPAESVKKPQTTLDTLGPFEPNVPVGVEFVKMGYYCRVCFVFYSNEDTAKKVHCSSQAHYEKLKKHLEKKAAKAKRNLEKN